MKFWIKYEESELMQQIIDQSVAEIKKELLEEIFLLLPEEEKNKEGNEKGFQVEFKLGEGQQFKIAYLKDSENKISAEFYIQKGLKLEEIEKVDALYLYKNALMYELRKFGKVEIVSKTLLDDCRKRIKERAELNLYKLNEETEV